MHPLFVVRKCNLPPPHHHAAAYISQVNQNTSLYTKLAAANEAYEQASSAARGGGSNSSCGHSAGSSSSRSEAVARLTPQQLSAWTPETVLVGRKLQLDMQKAGIHLPAPQRARMEELMSASHHFATAHSHALVRSRPGGGSWTETPTSVRGVGGTHTPR